MKKMSKNNVLHSQKLNCCNKYKSESVMRYLIHLKRYLKSLFQTFLKQIYRFGQLAISHVDGWFTQSSAVKNAQAVIKNFIQDTQNVWSVGQYGRILPICAKDTPHFWNEVYEVGTRGGNLQADVPQYGRSMIEMLGVLAIIGVLSVGGIAGYSKAMMKFKINKTVNQVSQISANVRTLYTSQDSYNGLNQAIVKKAKLTPDEVFAGNTFSVNSIHSKASQNDLYIKNSTNMTNSFGGGLWVESNETSSKSSGYARFNIVYTSIPEDACMELLTLDWGQSAQGLKGISLGLLSHAYFGEAKFFDDAFDSFPISVSDAAKVCNGNDNMLAFAFE